MTAEGRRARRRGAVEDDRQRRSRTTARGGRGRPRRAVEDDRGPVEDDNGGPLRTTRGRRVARLVRLVLNGPTELSRASGNHRADEGAGRTPTRSLPNMRTHSVRVPKTSVWVVPIAALTGRCCVNSRGMDLPEAGAVGHEHIGGTDGRNTNVARRRRAGTK